MNTMLMEHIDAHYKGNVSAFARRMRLKPGRVHHWLDGRRHVPSKIAQRLAARTGLPLEACLFPTKNNHKRRPTSTTN